MFSCFRYIPTGCRFYKFRRGVRRMFGLYLPRKRIVTDILDRMSHRMLVRWSEMDDEQAKIAWNTIGAKIRTAYGLTDESNPFIELDPLPDSDGNITNQYFPDNVSAWVIEQLRVGAQEYVNGT